MPKKQNLNNFLCYKYICLKQKQVLSLPFKNHKMQVKQLNKSQKEKLQVYKQMYLDKFFANNKPASKKEVKDYIHWFYGQFNVSKNKKPKVVLVNSPYELCVAISMAKILLGKIGRKNEVSNEVISEVSNEVWNEVRNEVRNEVWNEVWNEVGKSKLTWYAPQYYLSAFNPWVSFYDFFDKECFALKKSKLFNEYKRVLDLNIFWSVPFENFVFVSRNAVKYCRDSQAKLHSVSEPAVQFGGKFRYHLYYIHGVAIKRQMFKKLLKKEYTFQDWVKESNEEVKAAALSFMEEKWGSEYLFRFISDNLKEVDTYTDKKDPKYLAGTTGGMNIGVYTLFKGKIGSINLAFVRCYCPSTDRMFFLCVNAENKTAKDAIASLYRVPAKLKSEIKYIQRQGERFSTVFTDAGKQKLENMTPEEIADLVPVSGNEYFSKMKYEY